MQIPASSFGPSSGPRPKRYTHPLHEAEQIATKVRDQGRPDWTVYADNQGHGFRKRDYAVYIRAVEVMSPKRHLEIDLSPGGVMVVAKRLRLPVPN